MKVAVQFFSRLRDVAGVTETQIEIREGASAGDLLEIIYSSTPELREWDKSILVGAGLEFVGRDYVLQPDDQIAIMPPVHGG